MSSDYVEYRIPDALYQRLVRLADVLNVPVDDLVQDALNNYFSKNQSSQDQIS